MLIKRNVSVPEKINKPGRWKEECLRMKVGKENAVLLEGQTSRSNPVRSMRTAARNLGFKLQSQTMPEGVYLWREE
jgi:hypothetical protein